MNFHFPHPYNNEVLDALLEPRTRNHDRAEFLRRIEACREKLNRVREDYRLMCARAHIPAKP